MPPVQPSSNFSVPNYTGTVPDSIGTVGPEFSLMFIIIVVLTILLGILLIASWKVSILKKHRKKIIVGVVIAFVIAIFISPYSNTSSYENNQTSPEIKKAGPPVPAPDVEGRIHGIWAYMPISSKVEQDAEWMREVGINTITFTPSMTHNEKGEITEQDGAVEEAKHAINTVHNAGFRVMLEPSPMKSETVPEVIIPEIFMEEIAEITVKYAKIAEEYNVEYYSPLAEPINHLGSVHASELMQDVLPKIRKVYSGEIVWKKTSIDLTIMREWNQDTVLETEFKLENEGFFNVDIAASWEQKTYIQAEGGRLSLGRFEYTEGGEIFEKLIDLDYGQWYTLKIESKGSQTNVYLNNELVFEDQDKIIPSKSYILWGEGFRVRNLEIKDFSGNVLLKDTFENNNNWAFREGNWFVENGELVGSGKGEAWMIYDIDFSGYDYIAINMFREGTEETDEEYREYVRKLIQKTKQQADADGVPKIILGEFGGTTYPVLDWGATEIDASTPMTNEELAQTTLMVLEEAEDITEGYYYNGWTMGGQGIAVIPEVEVVIKDWYNSH